MSTDMPISVAVKKLTGFEMIAIEDHFGRTFDTLGGVRTLYGVVWALENRGQKTPWAQVMAMPVEDIESYFAPEPDPTMEALSGPKSRNLAITT